MKKTDTNYVTPDLHLAAYLSASGKSSLLRITGGTGQKRSFVLQPPPNEGDISDFYTGIATVSALRLCETLRSLKAAVRTGEGGQR